MAAVITKSRFALKGDTMNCQHHSTQLTVGCCAACGRWVCPECFTSDQRALACSERCAQVLRRREALEVEQVQSMVVSNWFPAMIPRGGYALAALVAVMPLLLLLDVKPGDMGAFLHWSAGLWLLSAFIFVLAIIARPMAARARSSLANLRAVAAPEEGDHDN